MKTISRFTLIALVAAVFTTFLTQCRKDTEVVVVPIHDTIYGKSITGLCTYPDYTGTPANAAGAVISLYIGTSTSGTFVATTTADENGNYTFPYLLANNYFLYATFNNENVNYKEIEGINFVTDPGYAVVLASSNLVQNITLTTYAATGNKKITMVVSDTVGSNGAIDYVPIDAHSQLDWSTEYSGIADLTTGLAGGQAGAAFQGGFEQVNSGFFFTKFYFDQATPANTYFKAYVLLHTIKTFQPLREFLGACVPNTLGIDSAGAAPGIAVPKTDTAWYTVNAGSVEKYGKGYLAHGYMDAFYKSAAGEIEPPRVTACNPDTGSWNGAGPRYAGPFSQRITKQVDMYFEYQGETKAYNAAHTSFNKWAVIEGQMDWYRSDFFVKNTSVVNKIRVTPHLQFKGATNFDW